MLKLQELNLTGLINKSNEEKLNELQERVHDNNQYLTGPDKVSYIHKKED